MKKSFPGLSVFGILIVTTIFQYMMQSPGFWKTSGVLLNWIDRVTRQLQSGNF
jgi:hypothetical protein